MISLLARLRQNAPRITARRFLAMNPGSHIQYFDDTPAKDPAKALATREFDPATARRKQREKCAATFSVQPFLERRSADHLLCVRTLGIDVDLVASTERLTVPPAAIDGRKEAYLRQVLIPFGLKPHWVIETRHGLHLLFRIQPVREPKKVDEALDINRQLVRHLEGDPKAVLPTQLLRVPGTLQFKVPSDPFLCRLLLDNSSSLNPYPLEVVHRAIAGDRPTRPEEPTTKSSSRDGLAPWRRGLAGAPEGERNVTAASLVGKILGRLPEELWETAGWGGLKEWNGRNAVALPERELRAVFNSILRRESTQRLRRAGGDTHPSSPRNDAESR